MISSAPPSLPKSVAMKACPSAPHPPTIFIKGCLLVSILVPLKLSLTYCALIPLILFFVFTFLKERRSLTALPLPLKTAIAPVAFFLLAVAISVITGLNPLRSFGSTVSLVFFTLAVPLFALTSAPYRALHFLLIGQAIAAFHSVLDGAFPNSLPSSFLGKVTESGQIAITFFVALGLVWQHLTNEKGACQRESHRQLTVIGATTTIALALFSFRHEVALYAEWIAIAMLAWLGIGGWLTKRILARDGRCMSYAWLAVVVVPLLLAALLVNLKRGPWFGVFISSAVFCSFFARKLLLAISAAGLILVAALPPIQERLASSYEHFTISGGRSTIWRIGAELCTQYPLGIGYRNSGILRSFAPEIPEQLDHFHNNLLNITAESGWLGCVMFLWLIVTIVRLCFSRPREPLPVAIGCGVISWQIAGLVEYNAGDAEVLIVLWFVLGVALQLLHSRGEATTESKGQQATAPCLSS